jgi:1-deoxy-D-xylulose-5-phosphate reductoisomerase
VNPKPPTLATPREAAGRRPAATGRPPGRRLIILGSTGSIGTQTVEVVEHLNALHARGRWPHRFDVVGLATGRNTAAVMEQALRLGVRDIALADGAVGGGGGTGAGLRVRRGPDAAERLVREVEADLVVGAMVGSAGLPATLAAVERGIDVALANKETLVAAGALVVPAARRTGARLLPVDSEHCAVWQCLAGQPAGRAGPAACPPLTCGEEVARVILTASGGPFRARSREETYHATPAEALRHPTWAMGPKVTVDSASLTNKALEVIEAHWLFGLEGPRIGVLIHPQSIVHAIVEHADGSAVAQMAAPDMRLPIQAALTHPRRPEGIGRRIDWASLSRLEFDEPDRTRFPALDVAYRCIDLGGTAGAVFNAANEAAVEAFLGGASIPFGRITELAREALEGVGVSPLRDLADVARAEAEARRFVRASLGQDPSVQR